MRSWCILGWFCVVAFSLERNHWGKSEVWNRSSEVAAVIAFYFRMLEVRPEEATWVIQGLLSPPALVGTCKTPWRSCPCNSYCETIVKLELICEQSSALKNPWAILVNPSFPKFMAKYLPSSQVTFKGDLKIEKIMKQTQETAFHREETSQLTLDICLF